ncbi:MAG: sensor histidine kinase [Armatimonadota bacterium]
MQRTSLAGVELEELRERISWLILLRWIAIAGVIVTVLVAQRLLGIELRARSLYTVTAFLAAYNLVFWAAGRWLTPATPAVVVSSFANTQIALDLIALTAMLHLAGGIENPFVCYFVFHIVISSILLSRVATYLQATLAIALLTGLALLEWHGLLPHYELTGFGAGGIYRSRIYVLGALFAIGTMLYISAFMATSITSRLRRREAEIVRLSDALRGRADDLSKAYDALRQLEGARTEYLHRVAHHIRSPLATVERMLAVIAEGRTGEISERSSEMLGRARGRIREVLDLARDLLALTRAREVLRLGDRKTVDLARLVREVVSEARQRAGLGAASVAISGPDHGVEVVGDPEALAELADNLVSNAIKYSPEGGLVRVSLGIEGERVRLSVADQGIGIPPEEQSKVFEEFYRATNARESGKEGTGLGLSIVRAIAEAHNGTISVESQPGRGATFQLVLPRALQPAGPPADPPGADPPPY